MNKLFVELLEESEKKNLGKTMVDHIKRLQATGGRIIGEITNKGGEIGYLGINGVGKNAVQFAFYPDHTYERLEGGKKIRPEWEVQITDIDMIARDRTKADKLDRAAKKELMFAEKIRLNDKELIKVCKENGISIGGKVADSWVDKDGYDYVDMPGEEREVATVTYSITMFNEDYDESGNNGEEYHDPFYIRFTRDAKNPNKLHAEQI